MTSADRMSKQTPMPSLDGFKGEAERDAAMKVFNILMDLPSPQRKLAIKELRAKIMGDMAPGRQFKDTDEEREFLRRAASAVETLRKWASQSSLPMSNPNGSSWHKLLAAWRSLEVVQGTNDDREQESFFAMEPKVFLVEHDWAVAFRDGAEFGSGAFRLPYPACCFEFVLGGKRVCALFREVEDGVVMRPYVMADGIWVAGLQYDMRDGLWESEDGPATEEMELLATTIAAQVRAVSIILDTGAFEAKPVPPPEKLNKARARRGELPIKEHHVVRVSPERQARRISHHGGEDPKYRVRCHFRRGHWRHYETHRRWIKWMLVGDPDLGFVDKHYRV